MPSSVNVLPLLEDRAGVASVTSQENDQMNTRSPFLRNIHLHNELSTRMEELEYKA